MTETAKHDTVLDTGAEKLGQTYASALIGAAKSAGDQTAERVVEQLGELVDSYLGPDSQLRAAFGSPRISDTEKSKVIDRLFGDQFDPLLVRFLKVMAARGRLGYVSSVRTAADGLIDDMLGRIVASVTTAVALDDATRTQVVERLSSTMNRQVRLEEAVDSALIGGMVIRVGDQVFDNSVANRLDKMARGARAGFSSKLLEKFEQFTS